MAGQLALQQLAIDRSPSFSVYLLGRRITCMTIPAIIESIHCACIEQLKITVANYNVQSFNLSMQLPWFYNFLQNAEIAHCDGVGIIKAIQYMGLRLPLQYRASYSLLMPELLAHCDRNRFSIFLLGSKPACLKVAVEQIQKQYPNTQVDGHHGYFDLDDPQQNDQVVQQINRAKPNVLIVGMGMPTQEKWVQQNRSNLDVNAILLGGAIIDRLAGVVPDCPKYLSDLGLEWFYRLCREPRRLAARYLLGNPAFLFHLALAKAYSYSIKVTRMEPLNRSRKTVDSKLGGARSEPKMLEDDLDEVGFLAQTQLATDSELDEFELSRNLF